MYMMPTYTCSIKIFFLILVSIMTTIVSLPTTIYYANLLVKNKPHFSDTRCIFLGIHPRELSNGCADSHVSFKCEFEDQFYNETFNYMLDGKRQCLEICCEELMIGSSYDCIIDKKLDSFSCVWPSVSSYVLIMFITSITVLACSSVCWGMVFVACFTDKIHTYFKV